MSGLSEEIEALIAIFGEDFEHKPSIWKSPCFLIKCKPVALGVEGVNVEVHLHFQLLHPYPKISPLVDIKYTKGLNGKEAEEIRAIIADVAEAR